MVTSLDRRFLYDDLISLAGLRSQHEIGLWISLSLNPGTLIASRSWIIKLWPFDFSLVQFSSTALSGP